MSAHCQGCGTARGERRVTHELRRHQGVETTERIESAPVQLQRVPLADFGVRLLCQSCAARARSFNGYLGRAHLTLSGD
jgi:hypothetical protein